MNPKPELCPHCKGRGSFALRKCFDHHNGKYEELVTTCTTCRGSGRVLRITIADTFEPYFTRNPTDES